KTMDLETVDSGPMPLSGRISVTLHLHCRFSYIRYTDDVFELD
ncbi:hypothetical protein AVEN_121631-1, partial [Araneus ventricosus]